MNMNKMHYALPIVLILLIISTIGLCFAQTRTPGVSAGDVFVYDDTYIWNSADTTKLLSTNAAINGTTYTVLITDVIGSTVYYNFTKTLKDGTSTTTVNDANTETGMGGAGGWWFTSGNLQTDDTIYPSQPQYPSGYQLPTIVNETVIRSYLGIQRETTHTSSKQDYQGVVDALILSIFYDKQTGMMVEYEATSFPGTEISTLISSSKWATSNPSPSASPSPSPSIPPTISPSPTVPEVPSIAVLSVLAIGITIMVVIYKKKSDKA